MQCNIPSCVHIVTCSSEYMLDITFTKQSIATSQGHCKLVMNNDGVMKYLCW